MSLRLFPSLAGRLSHPSPFRDAVRQFSSTVRAANVGRGPAVAQRPMFQFFTSSTPKMQFLSGGLSAGVRATPGAPPAWSPFSLTNTIFRRSFSTSRVGAARPQYYGRGGNSWQPRPKPGFGERMREAWNKIDPSRLVYGIIGINIAVFLIWQYAINNYKRFRDPSTYNWMYKNFINSMFNIREGRLWTLITSSFSHMDLSHLFVNCLGLFFLGPTVASVIGSAGFMTLYLGSGLFSAITSLAAQVSLPKTRNVSGSDGASGAIYGVLAFFGGLFPTQKFLFFFVIPMPAWLLIGGIFAYDLWGTFARRGGLTDSAGHVGGIVSGLAAALMVRRGVWRPRPW